MVEVGDVAPRGGRVLEAVRQEGEALLRVSQGMIRVALSERGEQWDTRILAERLARWRDEGRDVAFLVGGGEGLDPDLEASADTRLGLSRLTLPHELARVVLLEQLFRVESLWRGSPYHREGPPGGRR